MKPIKIVSKRGLAIGIAAAVIGGANIAAFAAPHDSSSRSHEGWFSERIHQQLNLTPEQESQWQQLQQEKKSARMEMREERQRFRGFVDAELAKPNPDLAAINNALDATHEKNLAAEKRVRQDALAFYGALTPERQAVIVDAMREQHQRVKAMREKIREHRSQ